MKIPQGWMCAAVLICGVNLINAAGIEEVCRLDRLPMFKSSTMIGAISSYDRTGGNDDGFSGKHSFVRKDEAGLVLADLKGPGVIYRIWTPTPTDDTLEFFFDGETTPRVELSFRDLFLGKHPEFPRPLAGFGAGGYYCYVPLPFATSCVVRVRAPKVQFYQINYALYGPETSLATFDPRKHSPEYKNDLKTACELWSMVGQDITRFTAPPNANLQVAQRDFVLGAKSTQTVFESKRGGRIVGLRLSPASAMAGKARDLTLKISFDGEDAAVLAPLGDFFGYAWGQPAMQSLLAGTIGETNYCYLPMPFDRSAHVKVISERDIALNLHAEVVHSPLPRRPDEGRLYALWRRENPTRIGEPFTFIQTEGRGHLVGTILQSQGFESGSTLFFEGDDQTTIDGELVVHGTGSEDYFNGGWYDVPDRWEKRISFPLSGCLGYAKHLGRTGAYRWFLGDAYPYSKSLCHTIEHAGEGNRIKTDYAAVTCLYAERRPELPTALPPLADRRVVDLDEVVFPAWWQTPIYAWSFDRATLTRKKEKIGKEEVRFLSLHATGDDWFGLHFISPVCDVPAAGRYAIYFEAVKGPAQARVQLFQNENPVADAVDLYAEKQVKSGRLLLGHLQLAEGPNNLMIKLVGKNEKSSGLGLDLVNIACVREK